jgi:hypothetical protein
LLFVKRFATIQAPKLLLTVNYYGAMALNPVKPIMKYTNDWCLTSDVQSSHKLITNEQKKKHWWINS